jgi:hypothetical protein
MSDGQQIANALLHPSVFRAEQFLHGALLEVAFLGDELLKGFDEGVRIAQGLGNGRLFGFYAWQWNLEAPDQIRV